MRAHLKRSESDESAGHGESGVGLLERRHRQASLRVDRLDEARGPIFVAAHHAERDAETEERQVQHQQRQARDECRRGAIAVRHGESCDLDALLRAALVVSRGDGRAREFSPAGEE